MVLTEIWKDIIGYEGVYQVSNLGRIKRLGVRDARGNLRKEKILALPHDGRDGYLRCILCKAGVRNHIRVHRVVAETFIPNPHDLSVVNHLDGNKQNNQVSNLEWCSNKENIRHAVRTGLKKSMTMFPKQQLNVEDVIWIKKNYVRGDSSFGVRPLAKLFGVSNGCISGIVHNRTWKGVG